MINTSQDLSGLPDPVHDLQFYSGVPVKRLLAWLIDTLIVAALLFAIVIFSVGIGALFLIPLWMVLNFFYRVYFLNEGSATLGMRMFGIEIRNAQGDRLKLDQAMWHTGLHIVFAISWLLLFGSGLMMLINQRGQGLHDYLIGTTAINRPVDS